MGVKNLKPRTGKAPMSLIPFRPLRAIAAAFEEGAEKYRRDDWREGHDDWRTLYGDAAARHVASFNDPGENDIDEGSGVHHLALASCCCMIALYHSGADYVTPKAVKGKAKK